MFHSSKKMMCFTAQVLIMLLFLSIMGCGHDSKSEQNVDPAAVYKGKTSQAIITSENAEYLAIGEFSRIPLEIILDASTRENLDVSKSKKRFQFLPIVQSIKQSTMDIGISKNKSQTRATARQVNYEENGRGPNSGTVAFAINVNDSTGYFSGTVTYIGFDYVGVIINGSATITGTFDFDSEVLSAMSLSYNALDIFFYDVSPYAITLTGTMSWDSNNESGTDTMSMNTALLDQEDDKTYWFKSYETVTYYENDVPSHVTVTGRFYDHDYGYVDLSASIPIPQSERPWLLTGDSGTWARVLFFSESNECLIEADTDGDSIVDWERGISELINLTSFYKQYQIE